MVLRVAGSRKYRVEVYNNDVPIDGLNELEYINGQVYANVWPTDDIAVIDPDSGQVTAWLDEFVRRHPEQWLWMHRRWKGTPTAPVRRAARSKAGDAGLRVPRRQES